jgi:hypothetical protein
MFVQRRGKGVDVRDLVRGKGDGVCGKDVDVRGKGVGVELLRLK